MILGDANALLERYLIENLPPDSDWEMAGTAELMAESFGYLTESLILGIIFVYLVMAAQFESFLYPLIILMTLPLAAVGAFGLLYIFGMTFNVFTFIGIIMLVGLVTKNGILLVDYTTVMEGRGQELFAAVAEAGRVRFRPVLMTAVSTILGMMPIALGYGVGGEARAPMGWAVVGGMFSATVLTLLVIPVVYTLFSQLANVCTRNCHRLALNAVALLSFIMAGWFFYAAIVYFQGPIVFLLIILALSLAGFSLLLFLHSRLVKLYMPLFGLLALAGLLLLITPGIFKELIPLLAPVSSGILLLLLGVAGLGFLNLPSITAVLEEK